MATRKDTRLHWAVIGEDGYGTYTLCGLMRRSIAVRAQGVFAYQLKHAVYSSADTCEDCRKFYEENRSHFDNAEKPWNEADEAMAFGREDAKNPAAEFLARFQHNLREELND